MEGEAASGLEVSPLPPEAATGDAPVTHNQGMLWGHGQLLTGLYITDPVLATSCALR